MIHLLKLLHLASVAVFSGALAVSLVIADDAEIASAAGVAAVRRSIVTVGDVVVIPSLIVLLLTGMLLVVGRPMLIHARWVWAKAALGTVVGGVALFVVLPAARRAASAAADGVLGAPALDLMQGAMRSELFGSALALGLVLLAAWIAVRRPRLGAHSERDSPGG
jgi:Predicted integral membrane protein (DUF2269)